MLEVLMILLQALLKWWFSGFVQQVVECTIVRTSVLDDIQGGTRNVIPLIVYVTYFYYYKNIWHLVQN